MSEPTSRAPDRDLLLSQHSFPGDYIIKAFGPADAAFRGGVSAAVEAVFSASRAQLSERVSAKGGKVCITAVLRAETVDEVIEVYDRLYAVADLKMIL